MPLEQAAALSDQAVTIVGIANILTPPPRTDISLLGITASEEAVKMKNTKVMNMIVLGAVLERTHVVEVKSVMDALRKVLPERHHHLLPLNEQAIRRGMELAGALEAV
jgi:2-oxoglutarate ferredoxin oxidoreductase subunit gamma